VSDKLAACGRTRHMTPQENTNLLRRIYARLPIKTNKLVVTGHAGVHIFVTLPREILLEVESFGNAPKVIRAAYRFS